MVQFSNLFVWLLFLALPISLIYLIYAAIKRKPNTKKKITVSLLIMLGSALYLVLFYLPTKVSLPDTAQLHISAPGGSFQVADQDRINKLKKLIEQQRVVRSTDKTVMGVSPYPADQGIEILLNGNYHLLARKDKAAYSFIQIGEQYYSVLDANQFALDLFALVEDIH